MSTPDRYLRRVLDGALDAVLEIRPDGRVSGWNDAAVDLLGWTADEAVGRPIETLVLAAGQWAELQAAVGRRLELTVRDKEGRELAVEAALSSASLVGEEIVVAFLRRVPEQRHDDDEPSDRALTTVARATRRFSRATDPHAVREGICAAAIDVCGAAIAYLAEPDHDRGGLVVSAVAGAELREDPAVVPFDTPSAATDAHRTRNPVFVPDVSSTGSERTRATARELGSVSGLVAPIGRELGVLGVTWEHHVGGPGEHTEVLGLLADEAAIALDRAKLLSDLEAQARTDPLTGVPNLRAWDEALARELASSSRDGRPVCVAVTDVDDFKGFNDSQGHPAGDRLLRAAVRAWQGSLRAGDVIARFGGDEFSVLLPNCRLEGAVAIAERLRTSTPDGRSCSVGVAEWDGTESPRDLVARADEALYEAKAQGRNRVVAQPVSR